ncbi:MAG TPA: GntR family transcriptional regulator [Pyrinomonadaceae bacterium]|jgi:GntR family transcriptional regulator|nr:GntR family transcriptional regulator [Pyrinomonadaceae bacterium]
MLFKPNPSSGVPIYLQLMEQIKHAVETGALAAGEQLPGIRKVAEDLVINPNTVAKAYRELEHEGVIELRQGAGAFVAERARGARGQQQNEARAEQLRGMLPAVRNLLAKLEALGLTEEEMRRLFEGELTRLREGAGETAVQRKKR